MGEAHRHLAEEDGEVPSTPADAILHPDSQSQREGKDSVKSSGGSSGRNECPSSAESRAGAGHMEGLEGEESTASQ
jgi:hypothetical protein